jgi:hypothetical protein
VQEAVSITMSIECASIKPGKKYCLIDACTLLDSRKRTSTRVEAAFSQELCLTGRETPISFRAWFLPKIATLIRD